MPKFEYTAFDAAGRRIAGEIDADSAESALRNLNSRGHFPVGVTERRSAGGADGASGTSLFARGPTAAEITLFTQELSLLLAAGQPLAGAIDLIEGDSHSGRIQGLARRLRSSLAGGKSLAEAMALEPAAFPPVYCGMVKAAEASGMLAAVLARIAETRERDQKLGSKLASAALYPALLILMAVGVVVLMIGVVVPQFKDMLGDQAGRLPATSRAVLAASDWLASNGELMAVGMVFLLMAAFFGGRQPTLQRLMERALFATPLVSNVMQLSLTARFCRTLGILLESGLGLPAALALTRDVITNHAARTIIDEIGSALREGKEFTEPLRRAPVFPAMVTSLLRIGAESGVLAASAVRLGEMYEAKLEVAITRLLTVLEPTIILAVSLFIGFIVLTIMSAIMGVYDLTGL